MASRTCNAHLLPVLTQPAVEQEWLDVTHDWVWTCTYANTGPFLCSRFQVNTWECNGCTSEIGYKLQDDYLAEVSNIVTIKRLANYI